MPYIQCRKRKSWSKVSSDICFQILCPYLKITDKSEKELDIKCTFKSEKGGDKKREKKIDKVANQGSASKTSSG